MSRGNNKNLLRLGKQMQSCFPSLFFVLGSVERSIAIKKPLRYRTFGVMPNYGT